MPQRVPLAAPDDRVQRVVLQQQHSPGGDPGRALGERRGLIGAVHQTETVQDHIRLIAAVHLLKTPTGQQFKPGAAVRAAILGDQPPRRQQPGRGGPLYGVSRLGGQCGRLGTPRLLGHRGVGDQLGQPA